MKKIYALVVSLIFVLGSFAQTSNEFWFAPPEVTSGHGSGHGIRLVFANTSTTTAATVTIEQPANPGFNSGAPIVIVIPASSGHVENMTPHTADLETTLIDAVDSTGLHITSTEFITCYYEVTTTNNPDIYALKGANGLGTEFYTPFQNTWRNGNYTPTPYSSFDIVATEDNTTVLIYPRVALDGGHPALASYSVTLMRGETYSGAVTSTVGADNPAGTAIVSDKPIAVSIKDDSVWPQPAGCKDLNGDQLVPADIVGNDYIATRGGLTVPEYIYLVSTANNNIITVDGVVVANLFNGETYRIQMTTPTSFISCSEPTYCYHLSGFGCETGGALLPPLNCAGSDQVNVVRSTTEPFSLNIVCPTGAEGDFVMNGSTTLIPAAAFAVVPNSGGAWMYAQITYNTTDVPVGTNNLITNSTDPFSVALINGGSSSGTRFGYFSEFAGQILISAGGNQTVCANDSVTLVGSVAGATVTGQWSTSGTGFFLPNDTTLSAIYVPSVADLGGTVDITLTSTGACTPETDVATITFTPAPVVDAGADEVACKNNVDVTLAGSVTGPTTSGTWSGGAGTFTPNANTLNAVYTPSAAEITAGSVTLTLTSLFGTCNPETDDMTITYTTAPTVDAGVPQSVCSNNPDVTLAGSMTIATTATWSGGAGTFSPNVNALNAVYTPTAAEIALGSLTLTLTTTPTAGPGVCTSESDNVTITFTAAPTADAGVPQSVCGNNADITLAGAVTVATGGAWTGGLGTYAPDANTLNAVYTPSAAEITAGTVTLYLTTTTGLGNCVAVSDTVTMTITPAPTVEAGASLVSCANNADVTLAGVIGVAAGGTWSGGAGSYNPDAATLTADYTPSAGEITAGTVTLTLTSDPHLNCVAETDTVLITINPAPTVDAGPAQSICSNNPDVTLVGSMTIATTATWSGGAGTFSPNVNALNAVYTPTAGEIASGSLTLTLTTDPTVGPGICASELDSVTITFTAAPTADAGVPQSVCGNNADITLAGAVTVATGGDWTGGLGTYAPDASTLNAVYSPSAAEITAGTVTLYLTTTTGLGNCVAVSDTVTMTITPAPTVEAGASLVSCANNADVTLAGVIGVAAGGTWSGGAGTYNPDAATLTADYTPSAGEITAGTVTLTLTSDPYLNCVAETDTVLITINPAPTLDAGPPQSICSNNPDITLAGSMTIATSATWSGGAGTFTPSVNALNAVYTPTAGEIASGSLTLTLTTTATLPPGICTSEADSVTITFTAAPTADAGVPQSVCGNNADITLAGVVTVATGGDWTGGLGTYAPDASTLNAVYSPSAAEITAGTVTLYLTTTTGLGNCVAVSDTVTMTITPAPTVEAVASLVSCANNADVTLAGSITLASGGTWSGGAGSYNPDAATLTADYTPSAGEITAGLVTLTLTSDPYSNCLAVTDSVAITITPKPTVDAGLPQSICSNNPDVTLAGIMTVATSATWSGGAGTYSPNGNALNAVYTPTAAEIVSGSLTLTLTTDPTAGPGVCTSESDNVTITFTPAPTVDAGLPQSVCANNADVTLNGTMTIATGGVWSGGAGTYAPNANALNGVYTPSAAEISAGTVKLYLTTTTGLGNCIAVMDSVTMTITPAPVVDAGAALTSCANNPDVTLAGSITLASGGTWSGGAGTYAPDAVTLTADYTPSAAEITAGTVTLTLTSDPYLNCAAVTDSVMIDIQAIPTVNAGLDQTICVDNLTVNLAGSVAGNTNTGKWTTTGSGFFVPNDTTLNATYMVSSADSIVGNVTLTLSSTNSLYCLPVSEDMVITILPAGIANAGLDQTVCANNANIALSGVISGGATKGTWTTTGTGAFTPNDTTLNATYLPSAFDKSNGSVTLILTANSCNVATSQIDITITPEPLVYAGLDQTICATNLAIPLVGSVTGASITGKWTTLGSGTFDDDESMTPVYTASPGDSLLQGVDLILTATNIGNCAAVSDTVHINIYPTGVVDAGNDQTLCGNNGDVSLNGVITGGATAGKWTTSGSGIFTPNDTTLNATYVPGPSDTANGIVNLILTATNSCNVAADFVIITYTPAPIARAGNDDVVCITNPNYTLNGSFVGSLGATWSTSGTGTFSPDSLNLNATYIPSAADISSGSVFIKLTTTGNGSCNAVSDSIELSYSPGVAVDAGQNQLVCSTSLFTILQGNVSSGSTTGVWTTMGTGTFAPDSANLGAEYHFSAGDITAGSVRLVLTSTNNGTCIAETDTMEIVFGSTVYTDAGADQIVCESNMDVTLNGLVSGGSITGQWFTNGSGTFLPNDTTLNVTYQPSSTDSINGSVELRLLSTNNGGCAQGSDTMVVTIEANPTVNAGTDIAICASVDSLNLLGTVSTSQGQWTTTGSGSFVPNDTTLSAIYVPSLSDIAVGTWNLILTSTGSTICNASTDTLEVSVVDALDAAFTYTESCIGKSMSFMDSTIVNQGTILSWEWDFDDGNTSTSQNPLNTFTTVGPYDVKLVVTSSLGCKDSVIQSILVNTPPVADFTFDGTLNANDPVQFTDASSVDVVNWGWDFNDGSTSVDENPSHTFTTDDNYDVELIVTNQYGCSDTIIKSLEITDEIIYKPVTPTAFSPNGDGENDVLYIRGGPFLELYWAVYNQWGNLIYEGFTDQDGWDGKWKGKIQPNTDYVVVIKATTVDGLEYNESNSISLIR